MKKTFRFQIDLRGKAQAIEQTALHPEILREQQLQAKVAALSPAELELSEQSDPLSAEEQLEAYNASLRRAQSRALGSYRENGIDSVVSFEADDSKWVLTQPAAQPSQRISHLVLAQNGDLDRYSLEHREGAAHDLAGFLRTGMVDLTDEELAHLPGYLYLHLAYRREQNRLACVVQVSRMFRDGQIELSEQLLVEDL